MPPTQHVWHLWPGRHWPALPEEEQQFVHDLQLLATERAGGVERMHYTAVLNALRCGITALELCEHLPGMEAADLLAAYVQLERLRMESWLAWREIVEDPCVATLTEHSEEASILLPVPLYRIATVASNVHASERLADAIRAVAADVEAHAQAGAQIEDMLASRRAPDAAGVALGTKLHHPQEPALWGSAYFLPGRVTALSPVRVADLLGERPTSRVAGTR